MLHVPVNQVLQEIHLPFWICMFQHTLHWKKVFFMLMKIKWYLEKGQWITNRLTGDEKKNWNTYYANYICCFHFTSGFNQAGWKGSFCKLVNQPVGLERLCSCAQRLNKRLWSVPEFVVVQLSGSQPPTRPEMTQPFREVKIKQRICIPSFRIKFSCFLFFLGSCDICAF